MNETITLFQIDFDRFSALAVDVDHQGGVWNARYESRDALICSLECIGILTAAEIYQLKQPTCFAQGAHIFRASLSLDNIEKAGFSHRTA